MDITHNNKEYTIAFYTHTEGMTAFVRATIRRGPRFGEDVSLMRFTARESQGFYPADKVKRREAQEELFRHLATLLGSEVFPGDAPVYESVKGDGKPPFCFKGYSGDIAAKNNNPEVTEG